MWSESQTKQCHFLLCDLLEFLVMILHLILNIRSIIETWKWIFPSCILVNMTLLLCRWSSWTFSFWYALQSQKHSMVSETQQGTKSMIFYWGMQDLLDSIRPWSICSRILPQAMSEWQYFRGKWNYSEKGDIGNFFNEIWKLFLPI